MTNARPTHCILTEGSLRAHYRKGREGKGREQGRGMEGKNTPSRTSSFIVTTSTRETGDGR